MEDIKILNVKSKICWIIFIIAQSVLVAFMIATLAVPHWVKLEPQSDPRYDFQGSLFKVTDGLSAIPNPFSPLTTVDVSLFSYITISCSSEYIIDVSVKAKATTAYWDLYTSWSTLFGNLWMAGGIFLVFELTALICLAIIITTLALLISGKFYFNLNLCASVCTWISHIIAIIGWIGYLDVTFQDGKCTDLYNGTNPPTVCAQDGPKLGIFVLILLPFIMIPYLFVLVLFKKQTDKTQVIESEDAENNMTHINQTNKSKTKEFS